VGLPPLACPFVLGVPSALYVPFASAGWRGRAWSWLIWTTMGASCVRDCERTAHELYHSEDAMRVQAGVPGHAGAGSQSSGGQGVKVGATFGNPMAAISGRGDAGVGGAAVVPPLYGMKALQQQNDKNFNGGASSPQASPRFEEVSHTTPRGSVPSELPTPGASPRDSPRPPDEKTGGGPVELSYEGERLDNMKHGTGRLRMQGCTYEGEFGQDLKHGQGVLTWDDGRQYRGQFKENQFHGSAVMTWPDGRKYCGQYVEDRKHGEGTFSWQDGRRYQGQWVVGKRHGVGVYTNAKGLTRTGMWQMDRPLHWEAVKPPAEQVRPAELPVAEQVPGDARNAEGGNWNDASIDARAVTV